MSSWGKLFTRKKASDRILSEAVREGTVAKENPRHRMEERKPGEGLENSGGVEYKGGELWELEGGEGKGTKLKPC